MLVHSLLFRHQCGQSVNRSSCITWFIQPSSYAHVSRKTDLSWLKPSRVSLGRLTDSAHLLAHWVVGWRRPGINPTSGSAATFVVHHTVHQQWVTPLSILTTRSKCFQKFCTKKTSTEIYKHHPSNICLRYGYGNVYMDMDMDLSEHRSEISLNVWDMELSPTVTNPRRCPSVAF